MEAVHYLVPGAVLDLVGEVRFTSIVLTWSPPQEPNGIIITYEVTYNLNHENTNKINITDASNTYILELTPNARVSDISVRAYTSVGPGDTATLQSLLILSSEPGEWMVRLEHFMIL